MIRSTLTLAATAAAIALGGAASSQVTGPQIKDKAKVLPTPRITPTPRFTVTPACQVDPAITAVTLTKSGGIKEKIIVGFEVRNLGRSAWSSGANQQNVTLTVKNGNTGREYRVTRPLPARAAPGARMLAFTSPVIANAFDTFEFSGTVSLQIAYDPDIRLDGNRCNDDSNAANNLKQITDRQVSAFLNGTPATQRF
jgi:hypothetical protein